MCIEMGKKKFRLVYLFIMVFTLNVFEVKSGTYPRNEVTEVEYQLIMEDSDNQESSIQKPASELELTPEEENELRNGICKVIVNEPNSKMSNAIFKRNEIALNKIEKNMYLFILSESLKDYAAELQNQIKKTNPPVTPDELAAVESALLIHCDLADLKELYNTLVNLPDLYTELDDNTDPSNPSIWENFVAIQLDRVYDYVSTHFNMFKKELLRLKDTKVYYERRNFFKRQKGKAAIMTIFYDWLDNMVCVPKKIDEYNIRKTLNEHLKTIVSDAPDDEEPGQGPVKKVGTGEDITPP